MTFWKYLLIPFAGLYYLITTLRNNMYDTGRYRSVQFSLPTINIGNLNTGGSGKTPHIEYLIRLLQDKYHVATLSRGYGRKTSGYILANEESDYKQIGDEPAQLFQKFPKIKVSVGENRILAVPQLLHDHPETQVILLDDAYQHRSIRPGLNILLTTFQKPFYKDHLLPMGRLRESRQGKKRADIIIVTKCPPDLDSSTRQEIIQKISPAPHQSVYFSCINYGQVYNPITGEKIDLSFSDNFVVVTGIAYTSNLYEHLNDNKLKYNTLEFGDHHSYRAENIKEMITTCQNSSSSIILTTEKDYTRLKSFLPEFESANITIAVLPIDMTIISDEMSFQNQIIQYVEKNLEIN